MSDESPRVSWYVSPDHFRIEQEKVLWPNWVSVARCEDLAKPGDYLSFDHAGERLLVTHGRDGQLHAFPNLCPHRGTTLVEGCGHARSIQCPYHLWTFDLEGRLVGAPDMQATPGFDRADHGLQGLAVDTWGGWVFVNLDPEARPLMESMPELASTYCGAYLEGLVRVGRTRADQDVNWKVIVENFIESYHHAGTHPNTLQVPYPYHQIQEIAPAGEAWSTIEHTPAVPGVDSFTASCIFPTHLFAILRPDALTWFRLRIPSSGRTEVEVELMLTPELAGDEEAVAGSLALIDAINAEDELVNRRTFDGLQSRFASFGPLSPYEKGLAHFRAWLVRSLR